MQYAFKHPSTTCRWWKKPVASFWCRACTFPMVWSCWKNKITAHSMDGQAEQTSCCKWMIDLWLSAFFFSYKMSKLVPSFVSCSSLFHLLIRLWFIYKWEVFFGGEGCVCGSLQWLGLAYSVVVSVSTIQLFFPFLVLIFFCFTGDKKFYS